MRSKFTPIYTFFACLSIAFLMISSSNGRRDNWAGHPNDSGTCASCHGGIGSGDVVLENLPAAIQAGETYDFTITINDGIQSVGGFQLLASSGTNSNSNIGIFTPVAEESRINNVNRLVQIRDGQGNNKAFVNGQVSWDVTWTAPADNLPDNVTFYVAANAANGNGGRDGGDFGYNTSQTVTVSAGLAVDFKYFSIITLNKGIRLNWSVSNENQTDFYIIERSTNGKEFSQIATQTVATSTNQYQFIDTDLVKNQTYYYRIKEVATDGKTTLSTIETATYRTLTAEVIAYPNPANTDAAVQVKLPANFAGTVQLVNVQGQVVYTQKIATQLAELTLPTTNVAAGVYQLILQDGSEVYQQKLVIR